jgi:hypothetical protein
MAIVAAAHVHWRVTSDAHHSATTHAWCSEIRPRRQTIRSYYRHFLNELAETCHRAAGEGALR